MVSTSFWSDHYVADLDPTEKLLFLYLLTNERSTLAGVYELPVKTMAVESGIESEMVRKILSRFEEDGKVKYENGWVAIKNFLKHHEHGSPTVKKGIEDAVNSAPDWAREFIGKGIDTLSPSSSALSSTSISADAQSYELVPGDEKPKKVSTSKYPNAREIFALWGNYPRNWDRNTTQLISGQNLYTERGIEGTRNALLWNEKVKHLDFAPKIDTPYDLDSKWAKLERIVDKQ